MFIGSVVLILVVYCPVFAYNEFYLEDNAVIEIDLTNFDQLVIEDDAPWVVKFYATWCGHSQGFIPEYKKLAKSLRGKVKVGALALDDDIEKTFKTRFNLKEYPSVLIFLKDKRSPIMYNGKRKYKDITKFLKKLSVI